MNCPVVPLFRAGSGTRRIGAELEMHLRRSTPYLSPELVARGCPTYEPGGQLELSVAPQASVSGLVRELEWCLGSVSETSEIALTGVNPWYSLDEIPLTRPTPRYQAMQQLFDCDGDAGRRMMRLTASLQVCVDLLPGEAGREQWLVANLAGPSLVAAFGGSRERTAIWQGIDPARTAYDGRHLDPKDHVRAYAAFARTASRLPIAEAADDGYHLGTLFPPVRPRGGYLELRYLDAQQPTVELFDTIWTLMYDEGVRRAALDLLLPTLPDYWGLWQTADPADLLDLISTVEVAA